MKFCLSFLFPSKVGVPTRPASCRTGCRGTVDSNGGARALPEGGLELQTATSCCHQQLLFPLCWNHFWRCLGQTCSKQGAGCLVQLRSGELAAKGRSPHGKGDGAKEAQKVCLAETAPALIWLAGEKSSTLVTDEESE